MKYTGIFQALFFIAVIIAALYAARSWFSKFETRTLIHILAPQDLESAVRVYNQFVATQRVGVERTGVVTQLQIPMAINSDEGEITVRILQGDKELVSFTRSFADLGHGDVLFNASFNEPLELTSDIDVEISSTAKTQDQAPLVYIEKADDAYPLGNYRIASNEKSGDIGMKFIERVSRRQLLQEKFQKSPLDVISRMLTWAFSVIVIGLLPVAIFRKQQD